MKKLIALMLMSVLLLTGCGSGISQEDLAAEWEDGYAQGKSDGYTVGYDEGFAAGASQTFMFQGEAVPKEEPVAEEQEPVQEPEPGPEDSTESSGSSEVIVYVTDTGTKYHQSWCSSLWNSSHEKTLSQAIAAGYGPCKNCDPPVS